MRRRTVLYGSLAIATLGLVVACGDDPSPTSPTRPTPGSVAAIEVTGPDSVAPGQSVQFVASIRQADGTTKSAASMPNLRWRSSNTSVMAVTSSGVVTANPSAYGEVVMTAELLGQVAIRGTREVVVQPEGTYRVVGSVRDAQAPSKPIVGARVEVLPGFSYTRTDSTGRYRLYGVPPQSSVRITMPGYDILLQPLELTANGTRDFTLSVNAPRLALNGPYTIALDTESPCSLNSALQHRTYDAVLTTTGTEVDVLLTEPRFRLDSSGRGNRFSGNILGGGVTFTVEYYYDDYYGDLYFFQYPTLAERLGDNTYLAIQGDAITTGTAAGLTGTFRGDITNWDSRFPDNTQVLGGCYGNFQFRVTPR